MEMSSRELARVELLNGVEGQFVPLGTFMSLEMFINDNENLEGTATTKVVKYLTGFLNTKNSKYENLLFCPLFLTCYLDNFGGTPSITTLEAHLRGSPEDHAFQVKKNDYIHRTKPTKHVREFVTIMGRSARLVPISTLAKMIEAVDKTTNFACDEYCNVILTSVRDFPPLVNIKFVDFRHTLIFLFVPKTFTVKNLERLEKFQWSQTLETSPLEREEKLGDLEIEADQSVNVNMDTSEKTRKHCTEQLQSEPIRKRVKCDDTVGSGQLFTTDSDDLIENDNRYGQSSSSLLPVAHLNEISNKQSNAGSANKKLSDRIMKSVKYVLICFLDYARTVKLSKAVGNEVLSEKEQKLINFIEEEMQKIGADEPQIENEKAGQTDDQTRKSFHEYTMRMVSPQQVRDPVERLHQNSESLKLSLIGPLYQPIDATAERLCKNINAGIQSVYEYTEFQHFEVESNALNKAPLTFTSFQNLTNCEMKSDFFKTAIYRHDISVVRDAVKILEIDINLFSLEALETANPSLKFPVKLQVPQPPGSNNHMQGAPDTDTFEVTLKEVAIKKFREEYRRIQNTTSELFDTLLQSNDFSNDVVKLLSPLLLQLKMFRRWTNRMDRNKIYTCFATNLDLDTDKNEFQKQNEHLEVKIPAFMCHKNKRQLLDEEIVGDKIFGLNTVQVYVKMPGSKTNGHVENGRFASVNINLGPGTSVWYSVAVEHVGQLEKAMGSLHMWPTMNWLKERGIPASKFLQKPGDLVFVNIGTYHWVTSIGFSTHISWNVAPPNANQLSATILNHAHDMQRHHPCHYPLVNTIWRIAKKGWYKEDPHMVPLIRRILIKSFVYTKLHLERENKKIKKSSKNDNSLEDVLPPFMICETCRNEIVGVVQVVIPADLDEQGTNVMYYCVHCEAKQSTGTEVLTHQILRMEDMKTVINSFQYEGTQ